MKELWVPALVVTAVFVLLAWLFNYPPAAIGLVYLTGASLTFAVLLISRLAGRPLIDDLPDAVGFSLAWLVTALGGLLIELWILVFEILSPVWVRACAWWKPPQRG